MGNYSGFSTKSLRRFLRQYRSSAEDKRAVMARHEPGTSHHIRALREANALDGRIAEIESELASRGEK